MSSFRTSNKTVRPNLTVVTLGVSDFSRSLRFYRDVLGWKTKATEKDPVAFFDLSGVVFSIYSRNSLAEDATVNAKGSGFSGVTFSHNARSVKEVDGVFARLKKLGAKIVKKPRKVFWGGYSGYFSDPDGHLWEVAHNPHWKLAKNGNVVLP